MGPVQQSGAIGHHDDIFIRVVLGDFGDDQLHALGVDVRQHK